MVSDSDSEATAFPPLKQQSTKEARPESPEAMETAVPSSVAEIAMEGTDRDSSELAEGERSSISVGSILDLTRSSVGRTDQPTLLEFSVDEPALPEDSSSESGGGLDLGAIFLPE